MSNNTKPRLLSGRVKKVTGERLDGTRYEYISLAQTEPDLGVPAENGSVLLSLTTGTRYWSTALKIVDDVVRLESGIISNSTYTGALVVIGGVGVDGRISAGEIYSDYGRFDNLSATTLYADSGENAISTNTGALQVFGGIGVSGNIFVDGEIIAQKLTIEYTTVTTTLVVTDDIITTTNETNAIGTDTGALVVVGGAGFGRDVWVGGSLYVAGALVVTTSSFGENITETLQSVTDRGNTTTQIIKIANLTNAESTDTGALIVDGGVGIGQDLRVGGSIYLDGSIYLGDALVITTSSFSENITETLQSVTDRGNSTTNSIFIIGGFGENSNTSTFNSVLSFDNSYSDIARGPNKIKLFDDPVWQGGLGISYDSLDIYSGKNTNFYQDVTADSTGSLVLSISTSSVRIWNTTQTTATNTGALIVDGGASIGGNLWVNETIYSRGLQVVTTASLGGLGVGIIFAGTDTAIDNNYGIVTVWSTSTLESVTSRGSTTSQVIRITNTSTTTSSDSGALTVVGGVGIGENLYVTGSITAEGGFIGLNANKIYESTSSVTVSDTGTNANISIVVADQTSTIFYPEQIKFFKPVLFENSVVFGGPATFQISTNTVYTDSLIELHKASTGSWTYNDGNDIGIVGYWYDENASAEKKFFFGYQNETNTFEFLIDGQETTPGHFSGAYGNLQVNKIVLHSTETSTSSDTGALVVPGGVGIRGDVNIQSTGKVTVGINYSAAPLPDVPAQFTGDVDSYFQVNSQNINTGSNASTDLVLTADNGSDTDMYMNIGIGGSNYSYPDFNIYGPNDGYITAKANNLIISTGNPGKEIKFYVDGSSTTSSAYVARIKTSGLEVITTTSSTSTITGAVVVTGGVGIGGDLNVGGRIDGGGVRTTSSTTAPAYPTVGDMWYDTINEVLLRYTDVGTGVFWLDLTGPVYNFGTTSTFNPNPIVLAPTYNFGTIPSSINEGSTGTFNVITSNVSNGTTLYWRLNKTNSSNADFHAISGSFVITDDEGSFDVETVAELITEGEEQFTVSIKTGSETGPTVVTSNSITINDTSYFIGRSLYNPGGNAKDVGPFLTGTLPYALGSNTFTWEAWIKPTSKTNNTYPGIFDLRTTGVDNAGWGLYWDDDVGSNDLNLRDGSTSRRFVSGTTLNAWNHVAVTRVGGQLRAYVNGQLKTGPHSVTNDYTRTLFYIGATFDTYAMEGYITNIRLVVGTALYTGSTYTVPTKPLSAITDTVFLLTADTTATYITDTGPNNITITNNSAGNSDVISWYDDTPFV